MHKGKEKKVFILCDIICEEQAFPHLLSTSNLGYNTPQDIRISPAPYSIILDDPLAKTKYPTHIELKERGMPHVHSFLWIFNPANSQNEAATSTFLRKQ